MSDTRVILDVQLSDHFWLSEFMSRDGSAMPWWAIARLRRLCVETLEPIRAAVGVPVGITSGYRSPAHNTAKRGAPLSRHTVDAAGHDALDRFGRPDAADIYAPGVPTDRLYWVIRDLMADGDIPMGGVGWYPGWVHVDQRGEPARWGQIPARAQAV